MNNSENEHDHTFDTGVCTIMIDGKDLEATIDTINSAFKRSSEHQRFWQDVQPEHVYAEYNLHICAEEQRVLTILLKQLQCNR